MRSYFTILKKELWCAFTAPQAWTLLAAYLVSCGILTLALGGFVERNSASLDGFFIWQPWLFLLLGSALGMGCWSEEYRSGTMELLFAQPVGISAMAAAKFTAGWLICALALLLTAPMPIACATLGSPDWGPVATGYLGCLLTAGLFIALSQAASSFFRSQFVSFAAALLPGIALLLLGFQPFNLLLLKWQLPASAIAASATVGLNAHFTMMTQGLLRLSDILWFAGIIWLLNAISIWEIHLRHSAWKARRLWPIAGAAAITALSCLIPWSLDLTADRLWTLDKGTSAIIETLKHDVAVEFYYSRDNFELAAPLRNHALRVESLLHQMADASNGKISIVAVNPVTDTEQAAAESTGLEANVTSSGELWFLGARIVPQPDDRQPDAAVAQVIPAFKAEDAAKLEYVIAHALAASQRTRPRRIGVLSSLQMMEHISADGKKLHPTWWIIQRLAEHFEVVSIPQDSESLPPDISLLLLVHPKKLTAKLEDALREFNATRPVIVCLDPLCQAELMSIGPYGYVTPSKLPSFLEGCGIEMRKGKIVADRNLATQTTDQARGLAMLPTLLTCGQQQFADESPVTDGLQAVTMFCSGCFDISTQEGVKVKPLLSATTDCRLLAPYQAQRTGADLLADFKPDGLPPMPLALEITREGAANVILTGDADWLCDQLCLNRSQNQTGEIKETEISDNLSFLLNAAEHLCDDENLLRLRTRGDKKRTFTRIEALAKQAEKQIQEIDTQSWREGYADRTRIQTRAAALKEGEDDAELQQMLDDYEIAEAARLRAAKVAQREVIHSLRRQLDRIERNLAAQMAALPLLLLLCAAIIGWKRRA